MTIEPTNIQGVYVCTPKIHEDDRGFFMESYHADVLLEVGITDVFVQDNHARSSARNTVRGLHFQYDPPIAKLVRVTRGTAFLVAVDIRKNSPTLGQWVSVEVSEDNKQQLYVPIGCAFGYQTQTNDCEVQYKCSATYNPEGEGAIVWNDPEIGIDWPIKDAPLLSKHSSEAGSLQDWLKNPASESFFLA